MRRYSALLVVVISLVVSTAAHAGTGRTAVSDQLTDLFTVFKSFSR